MRHTQMEDPADGRSAGAEGVFGDTTNGAILASSAADVHQLLAYAKAEYACAEREFGIVSVHANQGIRHALNTGAALLLAKEKAGHGNYLRLLKAEWPKMSRRSASRLMERAERWLALDDRTKRRVYRQMGQLAHFTLARLDEI